MRIVITKNGTKIIEDLSPNNSIDYNSCNNNQIYLSPIKNMNNLKKNKSVKHICFQKSSKINSENSSNANINENNIDINDMLKTLINKDNVRKINRKHLDNLKIINLKNNKKIKLPKLLENKYLLYDIFKTQSKSKFVPDILLSINDNIDNDHLNKEIMKRTKTFSDISNNKSENSINKDETTLPRIRKAFPLKYIIGKESVKRLNKEMSKLEESCDVEKKLFPNNYFIKKNWENSKKNFDLSLNNEINSKNINLIEYLNKDKNISNIFLQKFSKFNNEQIDKLESISKKLLYKKEQDKQINKNIKNKIKTNIMNININFRQSLNNINDKLTKYEFIINKDKDKFLINDKNKYLEQFMDAEKNWDKYNLERLYKKSSSPKRSAYRPLLEYN